MSVKAETPKQETGVRRTVSKFRDGAAAVKAREPSIRRDVNRQDIRSSAGQVKMTAGTNEPTGAADEFLPLFVSQSVSNNSFPVEMTQIKKDKAKTQSGKRYIPLSLYSCAGTTFVN